VIFQFLQAVCLLGWLVATGLAVAILYGLWTPDGKDPLGEDMAALYNATTRTVWGACIAWVIFACSTGNGGMSDNMKYLHL